MGKILQSDDVFDKYTTGILGYSQSLVEESR